MEDIENCPLGEWIADEEVVGREGGRKKKNSLHHLLLGIEELVRSLKKRGVKYRRSPRKIEGGE